MIPWIQGQLVDVAVDAAAKYKKEGPQVRHFTLIHVTQLTPSRLKWYLSIWNDVAVFKGETRINMCLLEVEHVKSGNIFSCLVHANTFKQNLVQLRPRFFMQVANFETTLLGKMTLFCFICLRVETGRIPFFYLCWASPFQLWFRQWISVGSSSNPFSCYRSLG